MIDVSGVWEEGCLYNLLKNVGIDPKGLGFVKNRTRVLYRGRVIDLPMDVNEIADVLSREFSENREKIKSFFEYAKRAYEEVCKDCKVFGVPLPPYLIAKFFGGKKLMDYPKEHPNLYAWLDRSFKDVLDEYFESEELKDFLSLYSAYTGTKPEKTSSLMALTVWIGYTIYGGYFIECGKLVKALRDVIVRNGGEVLTNCEVKRIVVENGCVKGVIAKTPRGEEFLQASVVISNVNAKTTFLELVGEKNLSKVFVEYIKGLKMSPSAFVVYLGVNKDLKDYPTILKDVDNGFELAIISNADKSLAPEGKSALLILTFADYDDFPSRESEEYRRIKDEWSGRLLEKAERVIPNLRDHIEVLDSATPKTMERYCSMPRGAIYSIDQSMDVERPYFKTPIRGLYLVGASTFPGAGIEGVAISGVVCAYDILKG